MSDLGLLIGLTSLPLARERHFWHSIIRQIFEGYKERADSHTHEQRRGSEAVYDPHGYVLLSEHDLAVISLYDEAMFPTLTFRAGESSLRRDHDPFLEPLESFTHHGMGGFVPSFHEGSSVDVYWRGIFPDPSEAGEPASTRRLPLIMISQLKLSSLASLHAGTTSLRLILWSIVERFHQFKEEEQAEFGRSPGTIRMMLSEGHSWNEITMLVWCDSYTPMGRFLTRVGETSFKQLWRLLDQLVERKDPTKGPRAPAPGAQLTEEQSNLMARHRALKKEVREFREQETLLKAKLPPGQDIEHNHIFETSISHLGFDIELFCAGRNDWRHLPGFVPVDERDQFQVVRRWFTRRGHLGRGFVYVRRGTPENGQKLNLSLEKGDFFQSIPETFSAAGLIDTIIASRSGEEARKHLTRAITAICLDLSSEDDLLSDGDHEHPTVFDEIAEQLVIPPSDINALFKRCQQLSIPKVVTTKILNCLSALNEGLRDRVTMASFLDLRSFPKQIQAMLEEPIGDRSDWYWQFDELVHSIWETADWFEVAYRNRVHSNYRLGVESSDLALDYKGCIVQLITGLDGAYKALCGGLGASPAYACVGAVTGNSRPPICSIQATRESVRFNFLYAVQPEFAAFSLTHEAAHFARMGGHGARLMASLVTPSGKPDEARLKALSEVELDACQQAGHLEEVFKEILQVENGCFYDEVLADIANFWFAYGRDLNLYRWWTRHFSWQNVLAHPRIRPRRVRAQEMQLRLRMFAVLSITRPQKFAEMLKRSRRRKGNNELMKFVDALLGSSKSPARDWLVDWNRTLRRRFMETYGSQQQYDAIWKRYADELRYGRVCEFHEGGAPGAPNDRELGRLAYVSALFHSVLALIHEDYGKAPCRLNRRSHDGEPAPEPDHGAYLFDPRGGVFLCGERARRDVMRTRAAFHMSLWDLSAKMKADDIYRRVRGSELPPGQL